MGVEADADGFKSATAQRSGTFRGEAIAKELNVSVEKLKEKISSLHEFNPMLGFRGCRLGITFPDIYKLYKDENAGRNQNKCTIYFPDFVQVNQAKCEHLGGYQIHCNGQKHG